MPCWYYEKREIRDTPSARAGIDPSTEARYRKEGARFIIDTGTKMGLRCDTCATGVVYFHRFYMFHTFREFNRYVTAATCLFLAGKVEETPKKLKDLIKTARTMLTEQQFSGFGDDPREELMLMEKILLQTLKFDLQVEHPYSYVIKFAKHLKGDKDKIQEIVQMAWTFVNDGLCTMICLQWEPDVVSVALMYLASRLRKYDFTDWEGKQPGSRMKWWEGLVSDVNIDVLESICHQVLDLYSQSQKGKREESPPPPPPPRVQAAAALKRSRPVTPEEGSKQEQNAPPVKAAHTEAPPPVPFNKPPSPSPRPEVRPPPPHDPPPPPNTVTAPLPVSPSSRTALSQSAADTHPDSYAGYQDSKNNYSQFNPYISSNMYSSSFMSQEGSQNIQSLMGNLGSQVNQPPPNYNYQQVYSNQGTPASSGHTGGYQQPPPPSFSQPPPNFQQPPPASYQGSYGSHGTPGYNSQPSHTGHNPGHAGGHPPGGHPPGGHGAHGTSYPPPNHPPGQPHPLMSQQSQYPNYNHGQTAPVQPSSQSQNYMQPPPPYNQPYSQYNQQGSSRYPPPPGGQSYQQPPPTSAGNYQNYQSNYHRTPPPRPRMPGHPPPRPGGNPGGVPPVRISGRQH